MYTKERLLNNSVFSKIRRNKGLPCKGVLTKEEAEKKAFDNVTTVTNVETGDFFFTDDYCIGVNYLPDDWVPCTTQLPSYVVPRETLSDGVVDTLDKYILIFHPEGRLIESVDELIDLLNKGVSDEV